METFWNLSRWILGKAQTKIVNVYETFDTFGDLDSLEGAVDKFCDIEGWDEIQSVDRRTGKVNKVRDLWRCLRWPFAEVAKL